MNVYSYTRSALSFIEKEDDTDNIDFSYSVGAINSKMLRLSAQAAKERAKAESIFPATRNFRLGG